MDRPYQSGVAALPVLHRHECQVVTILNSPALESSGPTSLGASGPTVLSGSRRKGSHPLLQNPPAHLAIYPHLTLYDLLLMRNWALITDEMRYFTRKRNRNKAANH
jgi:hypothetical protein